MQLGLLEPILPQRMVCYLLVETLCFGPPGLSRLCPAGRISLVGLLFGMLGGAGLMSAGQRKFPTSAERSFFPDTGFGVSSKNSGRGLAKIRTQYAAVL